MENKTRQVASSLPAPNMDNASINYLCGTKVHNPKDITKCLEFFHYTTGTTLDCSISTGILRNSITWYVKELTDMGLLFVATIGKDLHTGRLAKHYSADARCRRKEVLS